MSSQDMYQQAIRALDAKDNKAATNMFNRVIEFYPASEEATKARAQLAQIGGVVEADINKEPDVALTTSFQLEGYKIIKTIEIVTAECVFGMNFFVICLPLLLIYLVDVAMPHKRYCEMLEKYALGG